MIDDNNVIQDLERQFAGVEVRVTPILDGAMSLAFSVRRPFQRRHFWYSMDISNGVRMVGNGRAFTLKGALRARNAATANYLASLA